MLRHMAAVSMIAADVEPMNPQEGRSTCAVVSFMVPAAAVDDTQGKQLRHVRGGALSTHLVSFFSGTRFPSWHKPGAKAYDPFEGQGGA